MQLENDVEEWMRYKILKLSGAPTFNLRLKRNVVPHKFNCQTDRAVAHGSKPRTAIQKRDHLAILKTIPVESEINQPTPDVFENVLTTPDTPGHLLNPDPSDGVMVVDVEEVELLGTADKACQVCAFFQHLIFFFFFNMIAFFQHDSWSFHSNSYYHHSSLHD